jgi:small subunit ribosomal protein S6e
MPLKIVIAEASGKSWKLELADESLSGKSLGDVINGKELKTELDGYEFEIRGGSDSSGFPLSKDVEGIGLKRALLAKGFGMRDSYSGIRRRKTLRGKQITATTSQLNLVVMKSGTKALADVFPEQNKPKDAAQKPAEQPQAS